MIADFGIARAIDLAGVQAVTRTGAGGPGTPAYMSPEQLLGDGALDGRSDIYSLGCVLYEMLTGKPPFAGKEGFAKRFTEEAPPPSKLRKDIPRWLDSVVGKTLARDPEERYGRAEEFARDLTRQRAIERIATEQPSIGVLPLKFRGVPVWAAHTPLISQPPMMRPTIPCELPSQRWPGPNGNW